MQEQQSAPLPPPVEKASRQNKNKKTILLISIAAGLALVLTVLAILVVLPSLKYNKALAMVKTEDNYEQGFELLTELTGKKLTRSELSELRYRKAEDLWTAKAYDEAAALYEELGDYKDSRDKITQSQYLKAKDLGAAGAYDEAIRLLNGLGGYEDSQALIGTFMTDKAINLIEAGQYEEAYAILLDDAVADGHLLVDESKYERGLALLEDGKYNEAYALLERVWRTADGQGVIEESKYERALVLLEAGSFDEAYALLEETNKSGGDYITAEQHRYDRAAELVKAKSYDEAIALLEQNYAHRHPDSVNLITEANYKKSKDLIRADAYDKARLILEDMPDYKDSGQILAAISLKKKMGSADVGSTFTLGYDKVSDSLKYDIQWTVLDTKGDQVLVLSKQLVGNETFRNKYDQYYGWADSESRKWLNEDFLEGIDPKYHDLIATTNVDGARAQVFLLSREQVEKYMPTPTDRIAHTNFLRDKEPDEWMVTDVGLTASEMPQYVRGDGSFDTSGNNPKTEHLAWYLLYYRPAMWIDLSILNK